MSCKQHVLHSALAHESGHHVAGLQSVATAKSLGASSCTAIASLLASTASMPAAAKAVSITCRQSGRLVLLECMQALQVRCAEVGSGLPGSRLLTVCLRGSLQSALADSGRDPLSRDLVVSMREQVRQRNPQAFQEKIEKHTTHAWRNHQSLAQAWLPLQEEPLQEEVLRVLPGTLCTLPCPRSPPGLFWLHRCCPDEIRAWCRMSGMSRRCPHMLSEL